MRRLFLISTILMMSTSFCMSGQSKHKRDADFFPRSEIYLQYGAPTVMELATTLKNTYKSASSQSAGKSDNHKFTGVASLGYNYSITEQFAIGIYGGVSYASADIYITRFEDQEIDPTLLYRSGIISYTGQIMAAWTYFQRGAMECSSAVYLGVSYWDESITTYNKKYTIPTASDKLKFAYHISAVKFRYGETIGGFVELGFGYRGLVNIGMSVKL